MLYLRVDNTADVRPCCGVGWSARSASGFCFVFFFFFFANVCVVRFRMCLFLGNLGAWYVICILFFSFVELTFGWSWGGSANVIYEVCRHLDVLGTVRVLSCGRGVRVCFDSFLFVLCAYFGRDGTLNVTRSVQFSCFGRVCFLCFWTRWSGVDTPLIDRFRGC